MIIAILTPQSLPVVGGLQIVVDALARQLRDTGHQVSLFTPTPPPIKKPPYRIVHMGGFPPFYPVTIQTMPILEDGLEKFLDMEYKKNPFDILHAHIAYPTGFCALEWGKRKGVPVVITCHGIDVIGRTEDHYGFLLNKPLAEKVSQCLSSASALTIVSPHLRKHLLKLGASNDNIHIIPNGVFPEEFQDTGTISVPPYILALGCLHRIKGFDLLLKSFAVAHEKVPDMTLIIAGEGPDRASLIEQSFRLNLSGKVRFLPFLRGEGKIQHLLGCRFVVCPSRYESFGMVIPESNAAGKPVIGFSVGGIGELITHEKNGLLVPAGDVVELTSGMIKLWNREISFPKTRLIKAARKYDWKTVVQKYLLVFRFVLSRNIGSMVSE